MDTSAISDHSMFLQLWEAIRNLYTPSKMKAASAENVSTHKQDPIGICVLVYSFDTTLKAPRPELTVIIAAKAQRHRFLPSALHSSSEVKQILFNWVVDSVEEALHLHVAIIIFEEAADNCYTMQTHFLTIHAIQNDPTILDSLIQ